MHLHALHFENMHNKFIKGFVQNKEKSSLAGVYIVSNPIPKWAPAKIGSSLLKNDKVHEGCHSIDIC